MTLDDIEKRLNRFDGLFVEMRKRLDRLFLDQGEWQIKMAKFNHDIYICRCWISKARLHVSEKRGFGRERYKK